MKVPGLGCDVSGPGGQKLVPAHGSWNLLEAVGQSSAGLGSGRLCRCVCLDSGWRGGHLRTLKQAPVPRTACRLDASPGGQAAERPGRLEGPA